MHGRLTAATALACVVLAWPAASPVAAADEFPTGYEGYHTLGEMEAFLDTAVATYGDGPNAILARQVIGQSYEGRDIWAVKISDNVAVDEPEPEVLSVGMIHAREHITLEMSLHIIRLLTHNYGGTDAIGQRVTKIVDSREIWILPMANPDGAEYNISDGVFQNWRKNRQVNPGSDALGIDINRNFGFMWNCCGGSGSDPGSARYRGQHPWEAVENVVLRDFILGRRIDGQQQIKVVLNWHSYGEFVIWPYGYTKQDVPPTMTSQDHSAMVALATQMAALNGYNAMQGSDMYIYDGDFIAWAYGDQRIASFTLEMFPTWGSKQGGFKPDDEVLERETTRNTEAVLYAMEQADCTYRVIGLERTHCGPLNDDFETERGWRVGGSATSGALERAVAEKTRTRAGTKQRSNVLTGQAVLVTGAIAGANASANDVDGATSALSPRITLGNGDWRLRFRFTFAHDSMATADDFLRVSVVDGAQVTPIWTVAGKASERNARWRTKRFGLNAWRGRTIRLRVDVNDGGRDNIVEASLDDMRVFRAP